jgi:hypothetical protein
MLIDGQKYITEKEVARHYEKSVKWVKRMRYDNLDFPHYKLNGRVLFILEQVDVWIKKRLRAMGKIR